MTTGRIQPMLFDICRELLDKAAEAKRAAEQSDFAKGRHFALYEVIALIKLQAEAFGVDADLIGLTGIQPERDVLGK